MAKKYTDTDSTGIIYSNIIPGTKQISASISNGNNDYEYAQEDGVKSFVNAVEIDWNGAQLGA